MRLHFLSGGRLRMRRSTYQPGAPRDEMIDLPVSCALIRHAQGNVLFDTGCNPAAAADPDARWGSLSRMMTPIFAAEDTVVAQLDAIGLSPDDIDLVVCSHLHPDHCGCNGSFGRATIMCHAAELDAAGAQGAETQGYLPVEWSIPGGYTTFEAERDLFGDGRIVLLPLPGHTPGTTGALVQLEESGRFLLASDAAPMRSALAGVAPKNNWNQDLAAASVGEIKRLEEAGAAIVFGHDDEQWSTLRKGRDFYR